MQQLPHTHSKSAEMNNLYANLKKNIHRKKNTNKKASRSPKHSSKVHQIFFWYFLTRMIIYPKSINQTIS